MRGGAQAHLVTTADGHFYVVKFLNNPQHRRILVNEWIASVFLTFLGISTPEVAMINVSGQFLRENPEAYIQIGSRRQELAPGWHFGSRCPGDPARQVVYDFLPDALIEKVENWAEFRGVLAFDKWMANSDSRQAVFFRARLKEWFPASGAHPLRLGFVAQMVDNGHIFDASHWRFSNSPLQGLYFRRAVYRGIRGLDDFQPWLDRILRFPERVASEAVAQIPPEWLEGDEEALQSLLDLLMARRECVSSLLEDSRGGFANAFPDWL
jgi:hypothetical protein